MAVFTTTVRWRVPGVTHGNNNTNCKSSVECVRCVPAVALARLRPVPSAATMDTAGYHVRRN